MYNESRGTEKGKNEFRAKYMDGVNRILFCAMPRMLEVKNNYKNKYSNRVCRVCKCPTLETLNLTPVPIENIFSEDKKSLET